MKVRRLHDWDLQLRQAVDLQRRLASQVVLRTSPGRIRRIAAADVSYDRAHDLTVAAVALFSYPDLDVEEEHVRDGRITFPYIPGLLSFREVPLLIDCFRALSEAPDVVLLDGHGRAHPRRFGLASHVGLLLDVATIGCAKSRLIGAHDPPGSGRGQHTPLVHRGETVGVALTSRSNTKPIYVSIGHRIDLGTAIDVVLGCCRRSKHPEPLRYVDRLVAQRRRSLLASGRARGGR